jgi:hypothetical protein
MARLSQQDMMAWPFGHLARSGCPPQKPIIKAKEGYAEANVEELRNRAR